MVSGQKLQINLLLGEAVSLGRSEPLQSVGGGGGEGGLQGQLGGGAWGQQDPNVAQDRLVQVVSQRDLEALF